MMTLKSLRNEDNFKLFWTALKKGNDLSVCHPELPRRRKAPRRIEVGVSEGAVITDKESYYRLIQIMRH